MILNGELSAVITGGASGLGEGTARALAALGVKVAILDRDADRAAAVAYLVGHERFGINGRPSPCFDSDRRSALLLDPLTETTRHELDIVARDFSRTVRRHDLRHVACQLLRSQDVVDLCFGGVDGRNEQRERCRLL